MTLSTQIANMKPSKIGHLREKCIELENSISKDKLYLAKLEDKYKRGLKKVIRNKRRKLTKVRKWAAIKETLLNGRNWTRHDTASASVEWCDHEHCFYNTIDSSRSDEVWCMFHFESADGELDFWLCSDCQDATDDLWNAWYEDNPTRPIRFDPMKHHIAYNPQPNSYLDTEDEESEED